MDIQYLKGIGEKRARLFHKLGLFRVEDLLFFYPRAYEDRTAVLPLNALTAGQNACFCATVAIPVTHSYIRKGLDIYKTRVFDSTGEMQLTFFNAPYVKTALQQGKTYVFYGKTGEGRTMANPVFEAEGKSGVTGCIVPVYRATAGLSQGFIRACVKQALLLCNAEEILSGDIRNAYDVCELGLALENIHFPKSGELLASAKKRLVFDELLLLQLSLAQRRGQNRATQGVAFEPADIERFCKALPFTPTQAQRDAISDIEKDCKTGSMNRLLQGDVGCGKTVVAAAAAYMAFCNGFQTALMVPTEILAEQHANTLQKLLEPLGMVTGLLTGRGKRGSVLKAIASGGIHLAVGTHALISEEVSFSRLGMVITDEQHRFGVEQRQRLYEKGVKSLETPHRLVMSATPIPRTLARILYGDLDVTLMKGMPPGRTPVKTYVVDESYRKRIEAFVRKTVLQGGQVFIVCPLIEDDGNMELQAAETYAEKIKADVYPDLRVGLLHGKVKPAQRDAVMRAFVHGELDILVATTVIEVGVDVPNAALMVVENAERFGLSQLHQLRGRVGRGSVESHCVLFMQSKAAKERLMVMQRENDGYEIAEADLQLRGPGDFFGTRQHGLPAFRIADLSNDIELLHKTREAAETLRKSDPGLIEHPALRNAVDELLRRIEGGD